MTENQCKIVLVGNQCVGKTSIIMKFTENNISNILSTMNPSCSTKEILIKEYNTKLEFNIWDTAGEERYRGLGRSYYSNATAVILVFDITNSQSFEDIKKYWYNEIKLNSPEYISKIFF